MLNGFELHGSINRQAVNQSWMTDQQVEALNAEQDALRVLTVVTAFHDRQ